MLRTLAVAATLALGAPAHATTYTLDFDPSVACATTCGNGTPILQTYGDELGVDVVYEGDPNTTLLNPFLHWGSQYSNLTSIAYFGNGATLSFLADPGYVVGLNTLSLGAWPNTNRQLGFSITDLGTSNVVLDTGLVTVLGATASVFAFDISSTVGLRITFIGDFFNGGVDNIGYSAALVDPTNPIPLPAAGWMLLAGLGGMALLRRRAKTA